MSLRWICIYLLIAFVRSSQIEEYKAAMKSYVAAVVEFAPKLSFSESVIEATKIMREAKKQNAEIIVFPEAFITTYNLPDRHELDNWTTVIPSPGDQNSPCLFPDQGFSQTLIDLSCGAMLNSMYVVINLAEKAPCAGAKDCPKDNVSYYNTNVVFDRNGRIVARYRKVNLFTEPGFDVTREPEIVTFDTDFGVTFGTFICFDILFATPPLNLTRNLGITDIVYSTAWFSEAPFLTAVQTQAGWSYAEDVNLLAAGYSNPAKGSGGSGIYLGRDGIKRAVMPMKETTMLIVAEVPKKTKKPMRNAMQHNEANDTAHVHDELRKKREDVSASDFKLLRDNLMTFETEPLEGNVTAKQLCQNDFCCNFTIRMFRVDPKIKYKMVVFNGIRSYAGIRQAATRVCAVVQCSSDDVGSCGSAANAATTFNEINISGKFDDSLNSLIMPNTLNSSLLPLADGWTYDEHSHNSHKHVAIYLDKMVTNLLTFGIYCRDFDKDNSVSAASGILAYSLSALMLFLLSRFL